MSFNEEECPECANGYLVKRKGRFGDFFGCNNFPDCHFSKKIETPREDNSNCPWVNASALGQAEFCSQALYLNYKGIKPHFKSLQAMEKGIQAHQRVSRDKRCYIATHVFGDASPVTHSLRTWRDEKLNHSFLGRSLIKVYYRSSPWLIRYFGRFYLFNSCCRIAIAVLVKLMRIK